jgi:hypothetical protein
MLTDVTTPDRLLLAAIAGCTARHAARHVIDDVGAAVGELLELAGHRPDLLAEHAGVCLGYAQEGPGLLAPMYRAEAEICVLAGADESLIPGWIEVGRRRALDAKAVPYTGARPRQTDA